MFFNGIFSIYSFNLLFFTQVLTVLTTTLKYNEYVTDKGKNITVPCNPDGFIMWIKEIGNETVAMQTDNNLVLTNISESDSGIYICLTEVENKTKLNDISITNKTAMDNESDIIENKVYSMNQYRKDMRVSIKVRTPPGPVTELYFQPSTILGYLVWRYNKTNSGGYPIKSFTTEYREFPVTENDTQQWIRLDPINIAPNVRQMEIYHLLPNTSYEFRIWANNYLGPGEMVTTFVTTLPETDENDLIRMIMADMEHFDGRIWIAAVGIVLGTLIILAIGLCILLAKECQQSHQWVEEDEDGWDSIELVPNIVLNPGFCESDDQDPPYTRTIIFGEDDESDGYDEDERDESMTFKRKVSIFFTGHTIKRI